MPRSVPKLSQESDSGDKRDDKKLSFVSVSPAASLLVAIDPLFALSVSLSSLFAPLTRGQSGSSPREASQSTKLVLFLLSNTIVGIYLLLLLSY